MFGMPTLAIAILGGGALMSVPFIVAGFYAAMKALGL
jgi:hypothetical protein